MEQTLSEAATQRFFSETVLSKHAANLQENKSPFSMGGLLQLNIFSDHSFLRTPLGGCFCTIKQHTRKNTEDKQKTAKGTYALGYTAQLLCSKQIIATEIFKTPKRNKQFYI